MSCETSSRWSASTAFSRCCGSGVRVRGGWRARDRGVGPAAEVEPAHLLDGEVGDVVGVALHDPLEAVPDAQNLHALDDAADGGGGDDAVDAGGRAPAYEDRESL